MNRIYQVVWSKAKNCYTVVSEIAKRHGKGNRARTCAAAFLAALALTSVMGMSEAQAETIEADAISNGDARIALTPVILPSLIVTPPISPAVAVTLPSLSTTNLPLAA